MKTNKIPRNTLVLISAKISNAFESFIEKTCVTVITTITNAANRSIEKIPTAVVIIKNHNERPKVTANALNLGEDSSIQIG